MNVTDYARIERAIHFVDEHALEQPSLDAVARHLGLSPHHVQRLFRSYTGVSPKRFLQALTVEHAKACLEASRPVLDTALTVGLSGGGRLHDLFVSTEAVSPGEFQSAGAALEVRHGTAATAFGEAFVATTGRGVCALAFTDADPDALGGLRRRWPQAQFIADATAAQSVVGRVFGGDLAAQPLHVSGTNLQTQVWRALLRIPMGAVVSYGDLARRLGRPTAARAVAGAVARNPVAVLIPCHRVLRSTGALGGYRWGTIRKRALLASEAEPSGQ
jgi:AraC family transcriptional regulator of adaptative response/methylated-DNA-[protein]-cysteine methyltransferase